MVLIIKKDMTSNCLPPLEYTNHTPWFAKDIISPQKEFNDKSVVGQEDWIDLAERDDEEMPKIEEDMGGLESFPDDISVEFTIPDISSDSLNTENAEKLPRENPHIVSPSSSFGDRVSSFSYGTSCSPPKFHEDDILRYHSDNSLDSHLGENRILNTKTSFFEESSESSAEDPPRKIHENNPEFLKKQFKQVLSIYKFLNKPLASEKKKKVFIDLALHATASNSFDRIGRLMILKNFMLELRDTILEKEHKKNIIISFMDIMIDATIIDKQWYNTLKTWLQYDAIPTMDFLYLFRPDDFIPSNIWKWANK
jgi:hypothetical protein